MVMSVLLFAGVLLVLPRVAAISVSLRVRLCTLHWEERLHCCANMAFWVLRGMCFLVYRVMNR